MRTLVNIRIEDLPLTKAEVKKLTKQYSTTEDELTKILQWFEDSIDLTDDIEIRYMIHHVLNVKSRLGWK